MSVFELEHRQQMLTSDCLSHFFFPFFFLGGVAPGGLAPFTSNTDQVP